MDVRLRPAGCADRFGAVASLGLLPLVQRSQRRQFPRTLTADAMELRDGTRIAWSSITRCRATDAYVQGVYLNTTWELWYVGGRVHFATRQIEDAEAVVAFVRGHLPPGIPTA